MHVAPTRAGSRRFGVSGSLGSFTSVRTKTSSISRDLLGDRQRGPHGLLGIEGARRLVHPGDDRVDRRIVRLGEVFGYMELRSISC